MMIENKYLETLEENKFAMLDDVKAIKGEIMITVSPSV